MTAPQAGDVDTDDGSRARGHLKATAKHGSIYSIGIILSRMIAFVMIPVYTRVLTPADYGVLEILALTTDVVSMLAGFGIGLSVTRTLYLHESEAQQRVVASTAAFLLLAIFGSAALIGVIAAAPISVALLGPSASQGDGAGLLRLALLSMMFGGALEVPFAMLRARQRSTQVVGISLARLGLSVLLNIILVVWLRLGVAGVLWSTLITTGSISTFLLVRLLRENGTAFSRPIARQLAAFGAPLVIWNLASFVLHYSDRYFLRVFVSLEMVGLYSLSYKLAMLLSMLVSGPFSDVWIPKSLEIDKSEGEKAKPILRTIIGYYNLVLVAAGLGIALFAGDVIRLITGKQFHAAAGTVPILVLAMVFFGYRSIGQLGAMIRGRSDLIAAGTAVAAVVVTGLNYLLIPRWGVTGAAVATLAAFALEFGVMQALSARVYGPVAGAGRLLVPVGLAIASFAASEALIPADASLVLRLALKTVTFGCFALGLLLVGAIGATERQFLVSILRDPRGALVKLKGR